MLITDKKQADTQKILSPESPAAAAAKAAKAAAAAKVAAAKVDTDAAIDHTVPGPPYCSKGKNICSLSHHKNVEPRVMTAPESYTKRR